MNVVSMSAPDDQNKKQKISVSALARMAENDIDPTPKNYEIWYNYMLGEDLLLVKEISNILDANVNFDSIRNEDLYQKYFASQQDTQEIQAACSRIEASVTDIVNQIGLVRSTNTEYKHKLLDFSDDVSANSTEQEICSVINKLASDTESVINSSQSIELKLSESSNDITEINHRLKELSNEILSDHLTGIANRKLFESKLRSEIINARETGQNLCLVFMDIDDFKVFNDSYGHLIGDQVLKVTANLLQDNVKGQDLAARYGGEEFCLLLPNTSLNDATRLAERIGEKLASREINNKRTGESYGRITLSIGAAEYQPGESSNDLIQRADNAHYRAKRNGRNRVEIATERDLEEMVPS